MCLIGLAVGVDPAYRLVVAANRDEHHERPTAPLHWWTESAELAGGRDLQAGGTWLGATRSGRFAALTNLRSPQPRLAGSPSRGELVAAFLRSRETPEDWARQVSPTATRYAGFNLVFGVFEPQVSLRFLSASGDHSPLAQGVWALSNATLGTDWPKTRWLREQMSRLLDGAPATGSAGGEDGLIGRLFELLADESVPPDADLPDTGVGLDTERRLAPVFIRGDAYGTRSSMVLLVRADGSGRFCERRFGRDGRPNGDSEVAIGR
ncbi:MAG TPA: NRDE family protein [Burkholderiaceae bacterium]|nr:NRDE family protein [Burkholderiaceae bacterium]